MPGLIVALSFPHPGGGMHADFARAGFEDEPSRLAVGVFDVGPSKHVAQEGACGGRVVGVNERMDGRYHRETVPGKLASNADDFRA